MFEAIAFYFFGLLSIVMFFIVVTTNNILYALTALASGMIFISSFFFILNAEFLGVVQIAVYTGAVVVMYAFGMMFVDATSEIKERYQGDVRLCIMVFCIAVILVALFWLLVVEGTQGGGTLKDATPIASQNNVVAIGQLLFGKYLIAFEIVGVLLLCALIAGVALGIKQRATIEEEATVESGILDSEHKKHPMKQEGVL